MQVSRQKAKYTSTWGEDWARRQIRDKGRLAAAVEQTPILDRLMREVSESARMRDAHAVVLTGSAARASRTASSDIDFFVIGEKPDAFCLEEELDIRAATPTQFWERLSAGDSFTHWAAREGCVLWDTGVFEEGCKLLTYDRLWPDAERVRSQARRFVDFSEKLLDADDFDSAQDSTKTALSLLARALLLERMIFPMSRSELPSQLSLIGENHLARAVHETVVSRPDPTDLRRWVDWASRLLRSSG